MRIVTKTDIVLTPVHRWVSTVPFSIIITIIRQQAIFKNDSIKSLKPASLVLQTLFLLAKNQRGNWLLQLYLRKWCQV